MRLLTTSVLILAALLVAAPATPYAQSSTYVLPPGSMPSVRDYGAVGDGRTDDTAAIKRALADGRSDPSIDYYGRPRALLFPAGTYLVRETLAWEGCCMTLQGQGSGASIIRLANNVSGFADLQNPRAVIQAPRVEGNKSFRQNIWNLGIDTGAGNPGAIGLDFIASNSGGVRDVTIRAGDGRGVAGLALIQAWPGPLLVRDLVVDGFDVGVLVAHSEYGPTFEAITLRNQRVVGLRNIANAIAVHTLSSTNSVPAVEHRGGMAIIVDAQLNGGAPGTSAIVSSSTLYARTIAASGYANAIRQDDTTIPGTTIGEYRSEQANRLFDGPDRMLNLPVRETPAFHDNDPRRWATFMPRWYGDTEPLQATLDSGKPTVAFPFGGYLAFDQRTVVVPPGVRRIVGFTSVVNSDARGRDGGGIRFVINDDSSEPLIIEQFGYGVIVDQRGRRPVAIKHGNYQYVSRPGAGDLYLEDVEIGNVIVQASQRVWARQFNNETNGTKIRNLGGTLWILGLKTEQAGTIIETTAGGNTELLGGLIYPATRLDATQRQQPAFISRDSRTALIYAGRTYLGAEGYYATQVEETRGGDTRQLSSTTRPGDVPMFLGFWETLPPGERKTYLPRVGR